MKQTKETDKGRINEVFIDWFEDVPDGFEFYLTDLIIHVRNRTTLYYRMEDTFRRYLFQLRENGLINFECINKRKALYKSVKV